MVILSLLKFVCLSYLKFTPLHLSCQTNQVMSAYKETSQADVNQKKKLLSTRANQFIKKTPHSFSFHNYVLSKQKGLFRQNQSTFRIKMHQHIFNHVKYFVNLNWKVYSFANKPLTIPSPKWNQEKIKRFCKDVANYTAHCSWSNVKQCDANR